MMRVKVFTYIIVLITYIVNYYNFNVLDAKGWQRIMYY
jgi:hypothetical protein